MNIRNIRVPRRDDYEKYPSFRLPYIQILNERYLGYQSVLP